MITRDAVQEKLQIPPVAEGLSEERIAYLEDWSVRPKLPPPSLRNSHKRTLIAS